MDGQAGQHVDIVHAPFWNYSVLTAYTGRREDGCGGPGSYRQSGKEAVCAVPPGGCPHFQVNRIIIIIKRRIVVVCKECPAFVIHHGEIDDDHGIVVQRTLRIDSPATPLPPVPASPMITIGKSV